MIFLGWALCRGGIIGEDLPTKANKLIFNVLIPVLVFRDLSGTRISEAFDIRFFVFCFVSTLVMIGISWGAACIFVKRESRGSFAVCAHRSSAAVLGIAFAENIYGTSGAVPVMILASVPLYNIASVVLYSIYGGKTIPPVRKILAGVVKNPIIIAIAASIPFSLAGAEFPSVVQKCLDNVSGLCTPLALLMVGAGFRFDPARKKLGAILGSSALKLVIFELIFIPVAAFLGFRGSAMIALVVMCGSPATVAAYIMASAMDNDADLASGVVVLTTIASSVTVTAAVCALSAFSLV